MALPEDVIKKHVFVMIESETFIFGVKWERLKTVDWIENSLMSLYCPNWIEQ